MRFRAMVFGVLARGVFGYALRGGLGWWVNGEWSMATGELTPGPFYIHHFSFYIFHFVAARIPVLTLRVDPEGRRAAGGVDGRFFGMGACPSCSSTARHIGLSG